MTTKPLQRTAYSTPALEVRAGGRTIAGLCVPFNEGATIHERGNAYTERFAPGSFRRTIDERASKVKLMTQHQQSSLPIGRASLLREDAAGLYGEFYVSKTPEGDNALELIRDGALDAFSIGFVPIRQDVDPATGTVTRTEVRLMEVSVVAFPAYSGAAIAGIRSAHTPFDPQLDPTLVALRATYLRRN